MYQNYLMDNTSVMVKSDFIDLFMFQLVKIQNRVSFKPTPKPDAWKPPHEPEDVTKAIDISSKGEKKIVSYLCKAVISDIKGQHLRQFSVSYAVCIIPFQRPPSSDGHRSPSIPKYLMELGPSAQKKALKLEEEKAKVNKLEKEGE
jgi:hypothetical protein